MEGKSQWNHLAIRFVTEQTAWFHLDKWLFLCCCPWIAAIFLNISHCKHWFAHALEPNRAWLCALLIISSSRSRSEPYGFLGAGNNEKLGNFINFSTFQAWNMVFCPCPNENNSNQTIYNLISPSFCAVVLLMEMELNHSLGGSRAPTLLVNSSNH